MNAQVHPMSPGEEAESFRLLADLHLFLAQYFLLGPDDRLDGVLKDPGWGEGLVGGGILSEDPGGEVADLTAHRREFEALLRIPGKEFVPPMEQAYHPEKASVAFSAPAACEVLYKQAGYDRNPFGAIQADHVGHQLRFLAGLLSRLGDAASRRDEEAVQCLTTWREGFLRDRCFWWPEFSSRLLDRRLCRQLRLAAALLPGLVHLPR